MLFPLQSHYISIVKNLPLLGCNQPQDLELFSRTCARQLLVFRHPMNLWKGCIADIATDRIGENGPHPVLMLGLELINIWSCWKVRTVRICADLFETGKCMGSMAWNFSNGTVPSSGSPRYEVFWPWLFDQANPDDQVRRLSDWGTWSRPSTLSTTSHLKTYSRSS